MSSWPDWLPLPVIDNGKEVWIQPDQFQDSVVVRHPEGHEEDPDAKDLLWDGLFNLARDHGMRVYEPVAGFRYPRHEASEHNLLQIKSDSDELKRRVCLYLHERSCSNGRTISESIRDLLSTHEQTKSVGGFAFIELHGGKEEGGSQLKPRIALLNISTQDGTRVQTAVLPSIQSSQGYTIADRPLVLIHWSDGTSHTKHELKPMHYEDPATCLVRLKTFGEQASSITHLSKHKIDLPTKEIDDCLTRAHKARNHSDLYTFDVEEAVRFHHAQYVNLNASAEFEERVHDSLPRMPLLLDVCFPTEQALEGFHTPSKFRERKGDNDKMRWANSLENWTLPPRELASFLFESRPGRLSAAENKSYLRSKSWNKFCTTGILAKSFRLLPMDAFVGEILLAKRTRDLIDDYDKIRKGVSLPSEPFPSPLGMLRGTITLGNCESTNTGRYVKFQVKIHPVSMEKEHVELKEEAYKPNQMFGHLGQWVAKGGDPDHTSNLTNTNSGHIKRMWSASSDTMPLWISRRMEEINQIPLNEKQFLCSILSDENPSFRNRQPNVVKTAFSKEGYQLHKSRTHSFETSSVALRFILRSINRLDLEPKHALEFADGLFHHLSKIEQDEEFRTYDEWGPIRESLTRENDLAEEEKATICAEFRAFISSIDETNLTFEERITKPDMTLVDAIKELPKEQFHGKHKQSKNSPVEPLLLLPDSGLTLLATELDHVLKTDQQAKNCIVGKPNARYTKALEVEFRDKVTAASLSHIVISEINVQLKNYFDRCLSPETKTHDVTRFKPDYEHVARMVLVRAIHHHRESTPTDVELDDYLRKVAAGLDFASHQDSNVGMFSTLGDDSTIADMISMRAVGWRVEREGPTDNVPRLMLNHQTPNSKEQLRGIMKNAHAMFGTAMDDSMNLTKHDILEDFLNRSFRRAAHENLDEWLEIFAPNLLSKDTELRALFNDVRWDQVNLEDCRGFVDQFQSRYRDGAMHEVNQMDLDMMYAGRSCSVVYFAKRADALTASFAKLAIVQPKSGGYQSVIDSPPGEVSLKDSHVHSVGNVLWLSRLAEGAGRHGQGWRLVPPDVAQEDHWHTWLCEHWERLLEADPDADVVQLPGCASIPERDGGDTLSDVVMPKLHFLYIVAYAKYLVP